MQSLLNEATRAEILNKNKTQSKKRWNKRMQFKPINYDKVDIVKLFEDDYFIFRNDVLGSTGNIYRTSLAFSGFLKELKRLVRTKDDFKRINLQLVIKALSMAFDKADDVRVSCSCPDFRYRFNYHASRNNYKYNDKGETDEKRPANITNPHDNIGATCKHLSGMLSDKRWMRKASSYINSWIKKYPKDAFDYILPGYEEREIQKVLDKDIDTFDRQYEDEEDTSQEVIADESIDLSTDPINNKKVIIEMTVEELKDLLLDLDSNSKFINQIKEFIDKR